MFPLAPETSRSSARKLAPHRHVIRHTQPNLCAQLLSVYPQKVLHAPDLLMSQKKFWDLYVCLFSRLYSFLTFVVQLSPCLVNWFVDNAVRQLYHPVVCGLARTFFIGVLTLPFSTFDVK
jgi:hypothetical protein